MENSVTIKLLKDINVPIIPDVVERKADQQILEGLLKLSAYRTLFSFVERGGLYVGNAFLQWFRERLNDQQAGFADLTLAEFHTVTKRDLSLVATDTARHAMLVLNHRTAPNCPLAWAVRMSMSIPFAWHEVRWQSAWNPYRLFDDQGAAVAKEFDLAGDTIVDGGVLSNFPINLLTSNDPSVKAFMGNTAAQRQNVVGLLIDETLTVDNAPPPPKDEENDERGIKGDVRKLRTVKRVRQLLDTMMDAHDKQQIAANPDIICHLPAKTYGTMEFEMSDQRKAALVRAGEQATAAHLAARNH